MATEITVTVEDPHSDEIAELLRLGTEDALSLYPPENAFMLDIDELSIPPARVYVARDAAGRAVGMATLLSGEGAFEGGLPGDGELKRMFAHPEARGLGVGVRLLEAVEADARDRGVRRIVLETGPLNEAALGLYRRQGYVEIPLYGKYVGEPFSVCFAKEL